LRVGIFRLIKTFWMK